MFLSEKLRTAEGFDSVHCGLDPFLVIVPSPEFLDPSRRDDVETLQGRFVFQRPKDIGRLVGEGLGLALQLLVGRLGGAGHGQHGRPGWHGRHEGVGPQVQEIPEGRIDRLRTRVGFGTEMEFHAGAFQKEAVGEFQSVTEKSRGTIGEEMDLLGSTFSLVVTFRIRSFPLLISIRFGVVKFEELVRPRSLFRPCLGLNEVGKWFKTCQGFGKRHGGGRTIPFLEELERQLVCGWIYFFSDGL